MNRPPPSKTEKTRDPSEMDKEELVRRYRKQYQNITQLQRQLSGFKNNIEITEEKVRIIVKKIRILETALREIAATGSDDVRKVAQKALADAQLNRKTIISQAVQTLQ